jgi:hypothetical protein
MHSYVKRESEALFYSHHVPLDSLEPSLAHLPPDREIIAYFRDRCCIPSLKAVQTLRAWKKELPSGRRPAELPTPACTR